MWISITCGCVFIVFGAFELFIYKMNRKYFDSEIRGTVIRILMDKSQKLPIYKYTVDGKDYETVLTPEPYDKNNFEVGQDDTLLYHATKPEDIKLKRESYAKVYILFGGSILVGITIIVLALNGILKM